MNLIQTIKIKVLLTKMRKLGKIHLLVLFIILITSACLGGGGGGSKVLVVLVVLVVLGRRVTLDLRQHKLL